MQYLHDRNAADLSRWIKTKAYELGFHRCGIAPAGYLDQEAPRLKRWLDADMNGEMGYVADRIDVRLDPCKLLVGAKSVICLAHSYYTDKKQSDPTAPKISKYAQGGDYHRILRRKANALLEYLRQETGEFQAAVAIDSGAVLEKAWAARAGIGWVGKNSLIMHRDIGSFMFLALVIVDFELEYDHTVSDSCAHCTLCIDACPTGAIVEPHVVDARKCIAYLTIEIKGDLPTDKKGKLDNWIFGCDVCQDVCPWNRKAQPHGEPQFDAPDELYQMTAVDWQNLTQETFNRLFKGSPLARGGYKRLKRNLDFVFLP
ncbi:MAG: tRNA epoxyqueuosine(34) reductase QueG [Candidatus Zixiibacteriota bacterium]|nr:MAG: tRNA epoxyqueuosine(34) reductase QueG [candidate division Zixibacteria bacterium]